MLSNKKAFFTGVLVAPILCLSMLGGLGAAQSGAVSPVKDALANYLQPSDDSPAKITLPIATPSCQTRTMDIVAHQDDDILFMNPDLLRGLNHGDCVQAVYLTAGDGGQDSSYWTQRERGAEAAYSSMLKRPAEWLESPVKIDGQWPVNMATLKQTPNVSLIFIRLPDGNLFGDGFASTNFESLQKLEAGQISALHTADGQAVYNLSDVTSLLSNLINLYQPDQIRTQADDYPDHSDHVAVSRLVSQAYKQVGENNLAVKPVRLSFYNGYQINSLPENISGDDLTQKQNTFLEYAKFDNAVCATLEKCNSESTYGFYLTRQYQS